MSDLADYIHHTIQRHDASKPGIKAAEITAYDPNRHAVKAMLQPDGIETGWFPISAAHIGNGFGMVSGPNIGDQIAVGFLNGSINNPIHLGRMHSDKEQPPAVQAGEMLFKDGNGYALKFDKTGITFKVGETVMALTPTGFSVSFKGKSVTMNDEKVSIKCDDLNVDIGPYGVDYTTLFIRSNGTWIDEGHRHIDSNGTSLTGPVFK